MFPFRFAQCDDFPFVRSSMISPVFRFRFAQHDDFLFVRSLLYEVSKVINTAWAGLKEEL